ncbi:MAG: sulfite exporter TauE/SafE family protein [Chitinispirillaceae bacterium]|nr:sulfite exporter TauE/SafE family protein [Chitinispirillaceae bacterium]
MTLQSILLYIGIGVFAGISAGIFGIGGGLIIIPALIYLAGYSQLAATGTSLAVLLPPIGIAATVEYYRRGHVNLKAALIIAASLLIASWAGARITRRFNDLYLRLAFGIFLASIGGYMVISTIRKLRG